MNTMKQNVLLSLTDTGSLSSVYTDLDLKINDYVIIIRKKKQSEFLDIIGGRVMALNQAWAKSAPRIMDIVQKVNIVEYNKSYKQLELKRDYYRI